MKRSFPPKFAVSSNSERHIEYSDEANAYCERAAVTVIANTSDKRRQSISPYRLDGEEVLDLRWKDEREVEIIFHFITSFGCDLSACSAETTIFGRTGQIAIPTLDMTDAFLLAQLIISKVEAFRD